MKVWQLPPENADTLFFNNIRAQGPTLNQNPLVGPRLRTSN